MSQVAVYHRDVYDVLPWWPVREFDAVVTDPPYELGFMGKAWDSTGVAFNPDTWRLVRRVCKPGAHLLAFGGTRTWHRLACAIEDAGWEIRDTLMWMYGQGFPKGLDMSKALDKQAGVKRFKMGERRYGEGHVQHSQAPRFNGTAYAQGGVYRAPLHIMNEVPGTLAAYQWEGWGTALKPGWEPIILARAPLREPTVAANVARWGTGALNIDGCRLGERERTDYGLATATRTRGAAYGTPSPSAAFDSRKGRWPANAVLSHTAFCQPIGTRRVSCGTSVRRNTGKSVGWQTTKYQYQAPSADYSYSDDDGQETIPAWDCAPDCPVALVDAQSGERPSGKGNKHPRQHFGNVAYGGGLGYSPNPSIGGDTGGASRFFYVAKPSPTERNAGLAVGARNSHPTVKPIAVGRWLLRMITPPGGVVLDPFCGSGSFGLAARAEGFKWVGLDSDAQAVRIARMRLGLPSR